jgi:hypothetical protein
MSTRRPILAALAALVAFPLLLAGCKVDSINYFPPKPANVRLINLVPDAPGLTVLQGSNTIWSNVGFEATTAYQDFDNTTTQDFTVRVTGSPSALLTASYDLAGETPYNMIVYGPVEGAQLLMLPDTTLSATAGRFYVRFTNVAAGSANIDVYVTAPGVAIDSVNANIYNIASGSAGGYLGFDAGIWQVRATLNNTKTVVYDSGPLTFSQQVADMLFYTRGSGELLNAAELVVRGPSTLHDTLQARLKVVNAAVDTGAVNTFVDDVSFVSNVAAATASSYGNRLRGAKTIGFEAAATPGAVIASVATTLAAASDTTVFVAGLPGAQTAIALADVNFPPLSGNARLRVVNASTTTPAVNFAIDGAPKVSGLASTAASGYLEFKSGIYALTFTDPVTGTVLLALTGVELVSGSTSTVYFIGATAPFSGLVTRDD